MRSISGKDNHSSNLEYGKIKMSFGHFYDSSGPNALHAFIGQAINTAVFTEYKDGSPEKIHVLSAEGSRFYLHKVSKSYPMLVVIYDGLTDHKYEIAFSNLLEISFL